MDVMEVASPTQSGRSTLSIAPTFARTEQPADDDGFITVYRNGNRSGISSYASRAATGTNTPATSFAPSASSVPRTNTYNPTPERRGNERGKDRFGKPKKAERKDVDQWGSKSAKKLGWDIIGQPSLVPKSKNAGKQKDLGPQEEPKYHAD